MCGIRALFKCLHRSACSLINIIQLFEFLAHDYLHQPRRGSALSTLRPNQQIRLHLTNNTPYQEVFMTSAEIA